MPQPSPDELANLKLLILKDLEKALKLGYESQYKNILSRIITNRKKFMKKSIPKNISEDIYRYDTLAVSLSKYLLNLFEVFGESAVLNAKKNFEESALKWGRKLRKKLLLELKEVDMNYIIKNTYIDLPGVDYIDIANHELIWYLNKSGFADLNSEFIRYHPKYYDIKALWLHTFIRAFTSQYISVFEKRNENELSIITSIQIKEEAT